MINKSFAHLHVHDMQSLLDGLGTPDQYAERAAEMGFTHLALTNHGNVDGCLKWQKSCLKHDLKPILGCEAYVISDASHKKTGTGHITLLAKNEEGWYSLCRLLTRANTEGFYYKPRIAAPWFAEEDLSGLVILTGCMQTFISAIEGGMELLESLQEQTDVYLEIMPHDIPGMDEHANVIRRAMKRLPDLPLVASNDCHYPNADDAETQNVLLAVQRKAKWSDPDRFKFDFDGLHLRSADEMAEAFRKQGLWSKKEWLTGMRNSLKIAKQCCEFRIPQHKPTLPVVKGTEGKDTAKLLRMLATKTEAAKEILQDPAYAERLEEELSLIESKGFAPYFLLILDILNFCEERKIMVGPGRGSVGGSLVAYLTGITQVDPLKYDLLFNRFLEEDREDYPDIDMDFEDYRRGEIREYLENTYGKDCVIGVSTYFKMRGKNALRDVARVFDADSLLTDQFSKAIKYESKGSKTEEWVIEEAANTLPEGRAFKQKYPQVVRHAARLENIARGAGKHPAAVVVAGEPVYDGRRCVVVKRQDEMVSNWDMDDLEHTGLIKLDILGLNTLSVLNEARKLIEDTTGDRIVWEKISLDDKKVFEELRNGNTAGVFQLSAGPTTNLAKEMKISSFEEIVACIALVRPGPFDAGMTGEYLKRSKSKRWKKKHPIYEEITKETYGIVAYQEQVMRIVSEMAGLSRNYANKVRKVIGKKRDPKEFAPYWEAFRDGCIKQKTMTEAEAKEFWDELQFFASYLFNRSHAVEYSMLAYWTAWCKTHYPIQFICAALTRGQESQKPGLLSEAMKLGIQILPPRVGLSDSHRWIAMRDGLLSPFIEVKGIGDVAAKKCAKLKKAEGGFFEEGAPIKKGSALDKILIEIGAYDDGVIPEEAKKYFSFRPGRNAAESYPNLAKLMQRMEVKADPKTIELLLHPKPKDLEIMKGIVKPTRARGASDLTLETIQCEACGLRDECTRPVPFSVGLYNAGILAEAPGIEEDDKGNGLIGQSGRLNWKHLKKRGILRRHVYVSNVCKCYPSTSKTPSKDQMEVCIDWFYKEVDVGNICLILALGNTPRWALTKQDKILQANGTIDWVEDIGAWVCWCVHPAFALRGEGDKLTIFRQGLRVFADAFKALRR